MAPPYDDRLPGLTFSLAALNIEGGRCAPVPLKKVSICAKVVDFVTEVSIVQSYVNVEEVPVEAVYSFPVEEEAAVVHFEATIEGRTIVAEVEDKEEARKRYDEAVEQRNTAILVEEVKTDVFEMKLGQLKAGASAVVTLKYVGELPVVEGGKVCLTIPTTIAPRYVPSGDKSEAGDKIASLKFSSETPAPFTLEVEGVFGKALGAVTSPSHELSVDKMTNSPSGQCLVKASLAKKGCDLDRDVVIYFEQQPTPNQPTLFLERSGESAVAMLSLVPSFRLADPKAAELIFLVDRSGSMGGSGIERAKEALNLFLHSLPPNCHFNVWSFGSRHDCLFAGGSAPYGEDTLRRAKDHVRAMEADYGGTEIVPPLEAIFGKAKPTEEHSRQVLVLTDGEVSNTEQVVGLVGSNKGRARVFALGIGASASRSLVKGIARAGRGTYVFAGSNDEDLRPKVAALLKNSLQQAFSDVSVEWRMKDGTVAAERSLLGHGKPIVGSEDLFGQVPGEVQALFDGSRLLVYRFYKGAQDVASAKVTGQAPGGPLVAEVEATDGSSFETLGTNNLLHKLGARKKIQELEEAMPKPNRWFGEVEAPRPRDEVERAIKRIGIEHSLASRFTSFVGVDKETKKRAHEPPMATRTVPTQVPQGFAFGAANFAAGGIRLLGGGGGGGCFGSSPSYSPTSAGSDGSEDFDYGVSEACSAAAPMAKSQRVELRGKKKERSSKGTGGGWSQPEPLSSRPSDLLNDIIDLQNFDGCFRWGTAFENQGLDLDEVTGRKPAFASTEHWLTAIALQVLEKKLAGRKDCWSLVADKAKTFLSANLPKDQVDQLLLDASMVV